MPRSNPCENFHFDPEIERTFRQRRRIQRTNSAPNSSEMAGIEYIMDQGEGIHNDLPPPDDRQEEEAHIIDNNGVIRNHAINGRIPFNRVVNEEPHPAVNLDEEEQNIFRLANSKDGGIMSYAVPVLTQLHGGILKPTLETHHFELKPIMFQMLQTNGQYAGLASEDPHAHLRKFMEITDSFKLPGVPDDALKLKLFPFSLRDNAQAWYWSLKPDSIITWTQMAETFLKKYFPPTRNAKSRNAICTFRQMDDEAVPDAWDRFKDLLRKCPHHGIPYCIQLETFYSGLNLASKQMLDATANGAFTTCTYNQGYEILERISSNNGQWSDPRAPPSRRIGGGQDSEAIAEITSQLANMASLIKNLTTNQAGVIAPIAAVRSVQCTYCGDGHSFEHCPGNPDQVNYVSHNNKGGPFSQTYNPEWRNHPNFSWHSPALNPTLPKLQGQSNFQNQGQSNFQQQYPQKSQNNQHTNFQNNHPPHFQSRSNHQAESSNSLESLIKSLAVQTQATQASLKNLETQVSQMTSEMKKRQPGSLPSDTELPPRAGKEHVKAVTLRSGKDLIEKPQKEIEKEKELDKQKKAESEKNPVTLPTSPTDIVGPSDSGEPIIVSSTLEIPKKI